MVDIDATHLLCDSGFTLSIEEKAALQISMLERKNAEGFNKLYFWGKVMGKDSDYLICYGLLPSYDFPTKKFYFCTTKEFRLQQMPVIDAEQKDKAASQQGMFEGDPSFKPDGDAEEDAVEDGAEPKAEPFREEHRLAYIVEQIDFDAAAIPCGAYNVAPSHQIIQNKAYEGLNYEAASDLSSYYHFRQAVLPETTGSLEKPGLVRSAEFLDSLATDAPKGSSWSLQMNSSKTASSLRSLIWPGYFFAHKIGTGEYGGAYFGYGQKNKDIAFMM